MNGFDKTYAAFSMRDKLPGGFPFHQFICTKSALDSLYNQAMLGVENGLYALATMSHPWHLMIHDSPYKQTRIPSLRVKYVVQLCNTITYLFEEYISWLMLLSVYKRNLSGHEIHALNKYVQSWMKVINCTKAVIRHLLDEFIL